MSKNEKSSISCCSKCDEQSARFPAQNCKLSPSLEGGRGGGQGQQWQGGGGWQQQSARFPAQNCKHSPSHPHRHHHDYDHDCHYHNHIISYHNHDHLSHDHYGHDHLCHDHNYLTDYDHTCICRI